MHRVDKVEADKSLGYAGQKDAAGGDMAIPRRQAKGGNAVVKRLRPLQETADKLADWHLTRARTYCSVKSVLYKMLGRLLETGILATGRGCLLRPAELD